MKNRFIMRQAQQLQAKLAKAQEELEDITVEASSGGGAVKVVMSGKQKVLSVEISPEAINSEDVELLQDLVLTAVNDAIEKSQGVVASRLGDVTGGLNIPGLL